MSALVTEPSPSRSPCTTWAAKSVVCIAALPTRFSGLRMVSRLESPRDAMTGTKSCAKVSCAPTVRPPEARWSRTGNTAAPPPM